MARPNVYTYFDDSTSAPPEQSEFLRLWVKSWSARGWNPRILTVVNAQEHPAFASFKHDPGEYPRLAAESAKVRLCDMKLINFSYRPALRRIDKFKIIIIPYLEEGWNLSALVSFDGVTKARVIENCGRAIC